MNKKKYHFVLIFLLLSFFSMVILRADDCKIHFKKSVIAKAQKTRSLKDLYALTKNRQVEFIIREVDEITPEVEALWKEIRKRTVVDRGIEDDAEKFLWAMAKKEGYGIKWLQDNFDLVEMVRIIFDRHPCLKHIAIIKSSMNIHIDKTEDSIVLFFSHNYLDLPVDAPEIEIDRNSIWICLKKGGYSLLFRSRPYKPDIFDFSHDFIVYDKDNTIAEIKVEYATSSPSETLK